MDARALPGLGWNSPAPTLRNPFEPQALASSAIAEANL